MPQIVRTCEGLQAGPDVEWQLSSQPSGWGRLAIPDVEGCTRARRGLAAIPRRARHIRMVWQLRARQDQGHG
jgi:hypothetical protein